MQDSKRERLLKILKEESLIFGEVKLSSGAESSYYIDGKMVTTLPEGLFLIASIILDMIRDDGVEAIGGLTMGADPIAVAVSLLSHIENRPVPCFFVRKEPKKHGTRKFIEGQLKDNSRVAIVDDVITSGSSVLRAIEEVEKIGCQIVKVIAIVDREQKARERLESMGYVYSPIFTKSNLGIEETRG